MATSISSDSEDSLYAPAQKPGPLFSPWRTDDVQTPPPPFMFPPGLSEAPPGLSKAPPGLTMRLSPAARAFTPLALKVEAIDRFDHQFSVVIKLAVKTMRKSHLPALMVEVFYSSSGCAIIIRASKDSLVNDILQLAKRALLDAGSKSKSIFVMGYCTQEPFVTCPLGFEATLGAMENANLACWHIFKKGFCRHAEDCCKQHPSFKMPVRVLVDMNDFSAPMPSISDFQLKVAIFVSEVVSAVQNIASCAHSVEGIRDEASSCWTIVMSAGAEGIMHTEALLSLMKNTLLSVNGHGIYILGYGVNPFVPRPDGFTVVLGDMAAETRACWNFYSKGFCRKGCDCLWEHPQCSTPLNVIIKSSWEGPFNFDTSLLEFGTETLSL
jgi:hypothetical protein